MAVHPTAGTVALTPAIVDRLALVSGAAHSLALVSVLILFLGACGLTRTLASSDRLSLAAIVTYAFSCVAILISAAVSGFILPGIMRHMVADVPSGVRQWQIVIAGIFQINQGFARIYSIGASAAIILWSVSSLRNGGVARSLAVYGCIISVLTTVAVGSGYLRLDVHGMGAVVLGQAIWFVIAGTQLLSDSAKVLAAARAGRN